jgi:hypothetical protein
MKRLSCIIITLIMHGVCASDAHDFQLVIEPHWKPLEPSRVAQRFGSDLVEVGSIKFIKKAKEDVDLAQLTLQWKGPQLDNLMGSLYRKDHGNTCIPIEANLVCDGSWNKAQQLLKLTFDHKHALGPVNVFYVVLTIPHALKNVVKQGSFEVVHHTLPEPYRPAKVDHKLLLSLDALDTTTEDISAQ